MLKDFELLLEQRVEEVSGIAKVWRHKVTGAQILSVVNDDENKCFGVNFRTPPADSTGVAHILEHSVLCGSQKYKTKDPFVTLLKSSLKTFLNAFTFPDKTCYPVASTNLKDFYNLIDVYIDAVFHPLITRDHFLQEGWSIEAETADGPWLYKGVVLNEMKGVYSSADSVLYEQSQNSLFPDMLYKFDSGGYPPDILKLTYDNFKRFHEDYYHPSNAKFFFWGNDDEAQRLEIVADALKDFKARPVDSRIPLQKRLDVPRHIEVAYASSEDETRALFTLNWLLNETAQVESTLEFLMLEHILTGLPGSPLRKALIESGLGEDISGVGLNWNLQQNYYSVGLTGIDPKDVDKGEMLIFDTLAGLAEAGIEAEVVEAAVNSLEFSLRETTEGFAPRGIHLMLNSLTTWLYSDKPEASIATFMWEKPLAHIKARLAKGEKIFENLLEQWFLQNNHRSLVVLLPDNTLAQKRIDEEAAKLKRIQDSLSAEEREAVVAETKRLRELQAKPDTPEMLATIPALEIADLALKNKSIDLQEKDSGRIVTHDLDTSGISYADLYLPLYAVPETLIPLVPLFGRAITEMGTAKKDFVEMGMNIAANTGGVDYVPFIASRLDNRDPVTYISLQGKAVHNKIPALFEIMQELLFEPQFEQEDRFYQMLLEEKARLEMGLQSSGHSTVMLRSLASYNESSWVNELTAGISYLEYVRSLIDRVENDWQGVLADLKSLHSLIISANGSIMDFTAERKSLDVLEKHGKTMLNKLPKNNSPLATWNKPSLPKAEVFTMPAQINFVGKSANIYDLGYKYHGSANVIIKHLRMGYLWEKVRVQGGAYGAVCLFNRFNGNFTLASYRDPRVMGTLNDYDDAANYLRNFKPTQRELSSAIIGAIGDFDTYLLPSDRGEAAFQRHICKDTAEARQQLRDEILSTKAQHFNEFADVIQALAKDSHICILGGAEAEKFAKEKGYTTQNLL